MEAKYEEWELECFAGGVKERLEDIHATYQINLTVQFDCLTHEADILEDGYKIFTVTPRDWISMLGAFAMGVIVGRYGQ